MAERIFTLVEARRLLPQVDRLVESLQAHKRRLNETQALIESIRRSTGGNGQTLHTAGTRAQEREAAAHVEALRQAIRELDQLGVQVKDVDRGLVDFPAQRHGDIVLLCWLRGEPDIAWWHNQSDGFAGRQAIAVEEWE